MRKFLGLMAAASAVAALGMGLAAQPAMAQQTYPTAAGGVRVQGVVPLQCNSSGAACGPVTASNPAGPSQVVGNVASGATDSGNPIKIGGKYLLTAGAVTDGQRTDALFNSIGALHVTISGLTQGPVDTITNAAYGNIPGNQNVGTVAAVLPHVWNGSTAIIARGDTNGAYAVGAPSAAASVGVAPTVTAAVNSAVVGKASAGNLYGFNVVAGASAGFVLVFNAISAPADGAVTPVKCLPLAANAGLDQNYRSLPVAFTTGITVVFSTTGCFSKTASATAFISVDAK